MLLQEIHQEVDKAALWCQWSFGIIFLQTLALKLQWFLLCLSEELCSHFPGTVYIWLNTYWTRAGGKQYQIRLFTFAHGMSPFWFWLHWTLNHGWIGNVSRWNINIINITLYTYIVHASTSHGEFLITHQMIQIRIRHCRWCLWVHYPTITPFIGNNFCKFWYNTPTIFFWIFTLIYELDG